MESFDTIGDLRGLVSLLAIQEDTTSPLVLALRGKRLDFMLWDSALGSHGGFRSICALDLSQGDYETPGTPICRAIAELEENKPW
jgi:hypothetical protein